MPPQGRPPSASTPPGEDPLLPLVVAAQSGDPGAERELLLRAAPIVLETGRTVLARPVSADSDLLHDALVALLRALPALKGDQPVGSEVARIAALQANRLHGSAPDLSREELRTILGDTRGASGAAGLEGIVDAVLSGDEAVLVSHVVVRTHRRGFPTWYLAVGVLILAVAGAAGFWAARAARPAPAQGSGETWNSR